MVSILLVCTGNICRSPMAEGFVRHLLQSFPTEVEVSSTGVIGWEGSEAMPEAVRAASERGVDISRHSVRRLDQSQVEKADIVVCMSAEHREAVRRQFPEAERRAFTLKELVRLLEELPLPPDADRLDPDAFVRQRVDAAAELRASDFPGNPHDEDVTDPLEMSDEMFRAVAWDIEEWCGRLVDALFQRTAVSERGA